MKEEEIRSLEEFISKVNFLEESDIFRGHSDVSYKLRPSIGRYDFNDEETLYQFEKSIFTDFKRKAYLYTTHQPNSELEWLFLAQHHGLPTRLMDWTYNPMVALFFAVENDKESDCCIYRGMPGRIITPETEHGWDPFKTGAVFALIPNLKHVRYQNQNGLFTIHPKPTEELNDFVITKYIIRNHYKKAIRWKLRKFGITKALIYPSLDSLSYDIVEMTKLKYEPHFKK